MKNSYLRLQKTNKRRELLKALSIAGAAGTTGAWKKPVVDAVVLPAHAEMTTEDEPIVLCEITVNVSASPEHTLDFSVCPQNIGDCIVEKSSDSSSLFEFSKPYPVPPGVYICNFNGNPGNGTISASFSCCDEEPLSDSDNGSLSLCGEITIKEDGTCSIVETQCLILPSDIRLKTDIEALGESRNGLKLYRYKYLNDITKTDYVGVMAQDLVDTHPEALVVGKDGYYRVKYSQLGMRMAKYEEFEEFGIKAVSLVH